MLDKKEAYAFYKKVFEVYSKEYETKRAAVLGHIKALNDALDEVDRDERNKYRAVWKQAASDRARIVRETERFQARLTKELEEKFLQGFVDAKEED